MDSNTFYERLKNKYSKEFSKYDMEDIRRFLTDNYHNDDFEPLYNAVVERHNYLRLPPISLFREICDERGSGPKVSNKYDEIIKHNRTVTDLWSTWHTGKIIYFLTLINSKDEMDDSEKEFWGMYSPLWNELQYMVEKGYSKAGQKEHLNYVREQIKKGFSFDTIIVKEERKINFSGIFKENLNKEERLL